MQSRPRWVFNISDVPFFLADDRCKQKKGRLEAALWFLAVTVQQSLSAIAKGETEDAEHRPDEKRGWFGDRWGIIRSSDVKIERTPR